MNKLLINTTLAAVSLVATAFPVLAQGEKEDLTVLVTASRGRPQSLLEIPQSVSLLTREDIEEVEYPDVDELLRRELSIGLAPTEGNPNFWQEGFTIRGLGSQRVLTLTDGIRQAGQGIGYGGGNLSLYDLFNIERIEIVRGPSSVLYGTDAFGGVINIISREPRQRTEAGVNAGTRYIFDGSRDANRVGAYVDAGDKDYGLVLTAAYVDSNNPHLPRDFDPKQGSFEKYAFGGKAEFRGDDAVTVRLLGNLDRTSDVNITSDTMALPIAVFPPPGAVRPVASPLQFELPKYLRSLLGGEIEVRDLSDTVVSVTTGVYWQALRREFTRDSIYYPLFSPGFAGPPAFVNPRATVDRSQVSTDDKVNTIEWNSQAQLALGEHSVTVGFDLGFDDAELPETETITTIGVAGVGPITPRNPRVINRVRADAEQMRIGAYAQDTFSSGQFDFTPGLRLDYYTVENNQSDYDDDQFGVSGNLATLYRLTDESSAYLTLASGFRAPDLGERFQDGVVNLGVPSRVLGTEDLDPERAYTAEAGIKREQGELTYQAAAYVNYVRDYIGLTDAGVVQGFATERYENIGEVTLYGLELGSSYEVSPGWDIYGNAYRTFTEQQEKIDVADWTFNYGTSYRWERDCEYAPVLTGGINLRTVLDSQKKSGIAARSASQGTFEGDTFTVVDLFLNAELGETGIGKGKLLTGVRNLFDDVYKEPFFNTVQPGISGYVGVQFDF